MTPVHTRQLFGVMVLCVVALPASHLLGYGYGELLNASIHHQPFTWETFTSTYLTQLHQLYTNGLIFPGTTMPFLATIIDAFVRSAGLFTSAALIAIVSGIWTANRVVRANHATPLHWFEFLATIGTALPSLFFASGAIAGMYYVIVYTPYNLPIPLQGFGWDWHVLLPMLALSIRAWLGIAYACSESLRAEFAKPYITAVRAKGMPTSIILRNHVWPAQQRAIGLHITGQLRVMLAELIIVEYLFRWQGIGQLFATSIMPPTQSNLAASALYLSSPVIAATICGFVLLFCCIEWIRQLWRPAHELHMEAQEYA